MKVGERSRVGAEVVVDNRVTNDALNCAQRRLIVTQIQNALNVRVEQTVAVRNNDMTLL